MICVSLNSVVKVLIEMTETQYSVMAYLGKEPKKAWIYV